MQKRISTLTFTCALSHHHSSNLHHSCQWDFPVICHRLLSSYLDASSNPSHPLPPHPAQKSPNQARPALLPNLPPSVRRYGVLDRERPCPVPVPLKPLQPTIHQAISRASCPTITVHPPQAIPYPTSTSTQPAQHLMHQPYEYWFARLWFV